MSDDYCYQSCMLKLIQITGVGAVPSSVIDVERSGKNANVATGCRNYSIKELNKSLTERLHGRWHLLFVNGAWWLWNRKYREIIVAGSLNLKDRAAPWSARCVTRDTTSTSYPANVAIC